MLIQNAVKITEGRKVTYLVSEHTHDYNGYYFKSGAYYAVDGGPSYIRRIHDVTPKEKKMIVEFSLDDKTPFALVKEKLLWGSRGINGNKPLNYKPLSERSTRHLKAILATQPQIQGKLVERVILGIIADRAATKAHGK